VLYYLRATTADDSVVAIAVVRLFSRLDAAQYRATSQQYRSCYLDEASEIVALDAQYVLKVIAACDDEDRGEGWFHIVRKSGHLADWLAWLDGDDLND
jgi:hypothetical protein